MRTKGHNCLLFHTLAREHANKFQSRNRGKRNISKTGPGEGEDILQAPSRYPVRYRILRKIFIIKPTFFVVRRYPIFSITKFEFEYVDNLFSQISIILNRLPPTYDYVNNSCLWQTNSNSIFMIIKSLGGCKTEIEIITVIKEPPLKKMQS